MWAQGPPRGPTDTSVLDEFCIEALQRRLCGSALPCEACGLPGRIGRNASLIALERQGRLVKLGEQRLPHASGPATLHVTAECCCKCCTRCSGWLQQLSTINHRPACAAHRLIDEKVQPCIEAHTASTDAAQFDPIVRAHSSGDRSLRRQPCRPRDERPVKWGSSQRIDARGLLRPNCIQAALSVVATHNLPLLSVSSFFTKRSKLHHDGIQFLFSSSENFALALTSNGVTRASDDVALWVLS